MEEKEKRIEKRVGDGFREKLEAIIEAEAKNGYVCTVDEATRLHETYLAEVERLSSELRDERAKYKRDLDKCLEMHDKQVREAIEARDFAEEKWQEQCLALEKHCSECPRVTTLEAELEQVKKERDELYYQAQAKYPSVEEVGIEGLFQSIKELRAENSKLSSQVSAVQGLEGLTRKLAGEGVSLESQVRRMREALDAGRVTIDTPSFLNWVADRMDYVEHRPIGTCNSGIDYCIRLRRLAAALEEAIPSLSEQPEGKGKER